MSDPLVRFGVAMERSLLEQFDQLVDARGSTRSEALRDLARAAIQRADVSRGVDAVGTLTLIYDHHVRDLTERLTELQHELGEGIRSTLHIHLDHDHCLEIIVMHGRSDTLQKQADRILAIKGVLHGAIEIFPRGVHSHSHSHSHSASHSHKHAPGRSAGKPPRRTTQRPSRNKSVK